MLLFAKALMWRMIYAPTGNKSVATNMVAGVVALIPPSQAMLVVGESDATGLWLKAWIANVCEEESEEEREQYYNVLWTNAYRSKRRLKNMNDIDRVTALGIPYVVSEIMVQQAQRMHGVAVVMGGVIQQGAATSQQAGQPSSAVCWSSADLAEFPRPEKGGSMGLPPRTQLLPHLARIQYYAVPRS